MALLARWKKTKGVRPETLVLRAFDFENRDSFSKTEVRVMLHLIKLSRSRLNVRKKIFAVGGVLFLMMLTLPLVLSKGLLSDAKRQEMGVNLAIFSISLSLVTTFILFMQALHKHMKLDDMDGTEEQPRASAVRQPPLLVPAGNMENGSLECPTPAKPIDENKTEEST